MSGGSGSDAVALIKGRDALTVSDFGGTLASRFTLLVRVKSPLGAAMSGRSSRELPDDTGDGDEEGVDTDVSWVVTLPFVTLEGVV
jgi:hypothetical protein